MNDRFLSTLGMAMKAGQVVAGSHLVTALVRGQKKPSLVFLAKDASGNTVDLIESVCRHHKVSCRKLAYDMEQISKAIGKSNDIACVAIGDKGFAQSLNQKLDANQTELTSQGV